MSSNNTEMPGSSQSVLLTPKQLYNIMQNPSKYSYSDVIVLDSTWLLNPPKERNARKEFEEVGRIPTAMFFDIDACAAPYYDEPLDHMMPSYDYFTKYTEKLFANRDVEKNSYSNTSEDRKKSSLVVVYDTMGTFSSPRAWWTFKTFGYSNVAILNGGLSNWVVEGFSLEKGPWNHEFNASSKEVMEMMIKEMTKDTSTPENKFSEENKFPTTYATTSKAKFNPDTPSPVSSVKTYFDMQKVVEECKKASQNSDKYSSSFNNSIPVVLDARNNQRYSGDANERPGIFGGHIPYSSNLFFTHLMKKHTVPEIVMEANGLKTNSYTTMETSPENLIELFKNNTVVNNTEITNQCQHMTDFKSYNDKNQKFVFSCGSGISASTLFVAFFQSGFPWENMSVYDGSWTEWAAYKAGLLSETTQSYPH